MRVKEHSCFNLATQLCSACFRLRLVGLCAALCLPLCPPPDHFIVVAMTTVCNAPPPSQARKLSRPKYSAPKTNLLARRAARGEGSFNPMISYARAGAGRRLRLGTSSLGCICICTELLRQKAREVAGSFEYCDSHGRTQSRRVSWPCQ